MQRAFLFGCLTIIVVMVGSVNCQCEVDLLTNTDNLESCINAVEQGVLAVPFTPFGAGVDFSVYLDAVFCTKSEELAACCGTICAQGGAFRVNPLDKTNIPENYEVRKEPVINLYNSSNAVIGENDRFSVMLLDLNNNWMHWLRMDLEIKVFNGRVALDMASGQEVISYASPAVANFEYMLILFRQGLQYDGNIAQYASDRTTSNSPMAAFCSSEPRCINAPNLSEVTTAYNLEPLGATYFKIKESSNFTLTLRVDRLRIPFDSPFACADQLNEQGECPTTTTTTTTTTPEPFLPIRSWYRSQYGSRYGSRYSSYGQGSAVCTFTRPGREVCNMCKEAFFRDFMRVPSMFQQPWRGRGRYYGRRWFGGK